MQYKSMQAAGQIPATLMPDTPQVHHGVVMLDYKLSELEIEETAFTSKKLKTSIRK